MQLVYKRSAPHPAGDDTPRGERPAALHYIPAREEAARRELLGHVQLGRGRRLLGRCRSRGELHKKTYCGIFEVKGSLAALCTCM